MRGLTSAQAQANLKQHGFNELPSTKAKSVWRIGLEVMKEPMFILLISCAMLYIVLGNHTEGIILFSAVFVIIGITFYQYTKTERALEALKRLSSPRVLVIRDDVEIRIPGREVVPDDVVVLNEGDRIPADATILSTNHLIVDESILTGESMPVSKSTEEDSQAVYSGTLVVQGHALAKVIATGTKGKLGKIATSITDQEDVKSNLQKEMKVLIKVFFIISIFICISVVILSYINRGNFLQSLLNGLSSSMAILPEEFPVVLTIFLALGAWRLSRKNVLTRKPFAIETLGSATVLCSDKTGTITCNKMEIASIYLDNEVCVISSDQQPDARFANVLNVALNASVDDTIDPMELAIASTTKKLISTFSERKLLKEYPLSKSLLALSRAHSKSDSAEVEISCKGAPETIFKLCRLNADEAKRHMVSLNKMAESGQRVLGVATAIWTQKQLPEKQEEFHFQFLGLIGFEDPIRPEVPNAVKECKSAGVRVIMITGDYPATARSIANRIGLTDGKMISGMELESLTDAELKSEISNVSVFARVVPEQKLRIVQALKSNGEVVAMTGDGVNDAPALKAAHIGVAMGIKGTDVAREASSLVLLDDNFASIVTAIRLGRKIFDNLQKALSYIVAIHIPIIGLAMLPAIFSSFPLLILPVHIVFMELIIDPVCSVTFENEQEEKGIMERKPRKTNEKFFGGKNFRMSIFQGLVLLVMVLTVFMLSRNEGHSNEEVRAITFSALIIGNLFLVLTNLSKTRFFVSVFLEKNYSAILILVSALGFLFMAISIPFLQRVFSFGFPGYKHFLIAIIGAGLMFALFEAIKFSKNRKEFFSLKENAKH